MAFFIRLRIGLFFPTQNGPFYPTLNGLFHPTRTPLVDGGDCLPDYIHDMLICAHSFSNVYMVIAPGVALLHAGISKNVIRPGIALTLLSHPVYVQGKSIFCAFALCATDKVSHAKALKELGELLNEAEFIKRLAEIRSYSDLIDLIIIFEKEK